jgi:hypothetical protein
MNIFYLHRNARICAEMHNDKHCIKMILEYAQLLSTAHRVIDGTATDCLSRSGRKQTRYILPDEREHVLYSATHINHPSAIWVRQSKQNYVWLHALLAALCKEYTFRYGKVHKCERDYLVEYLTEPPINIPNKPFTEPTPAMDKMYIIKNDSLNSYRNYYRQGKKHLANWSGKYNSRSVPDWYSLEIF